MMYHIHGTGKWSQCIDKFSDVDFLGDNSTDSDEAIQYRREL